MSCCCKLSKGVQVLWPRPCYRGVECGVFRSKVPEGGYIRNYIGKYDRGLLRGMLGA